MDVFHYSFLRDKKGKPGLPWANWFLLQKVPETLGAGGVAELSESLGLYLSDALPGDTELAAHLLQGASAAVDKAKT